MKVSKKIAVPAAALCIIGAGMYGATQVATAATDTSSKPKSLAQEIAQTFNLDQSKVQSVIDQHKSETAANRETNYENRLSQAVTAGQLTDAQKDTILTEHNQLLGELNAASAKTGSDRRNAIKQVVQEGKTWARQNNIDPKWLIVGELRPSASPQA